MFGHIYAKRKFYVNDTEVTEAVFDKYDYSRSLNKLEVTCDVCGERMVMGKEYICAVEHEGEYLCDACEACWGRYSDAAIYEKVMSVPLFKTA